MKIYIAIGNDQPIFLYFLYTQSIFNPHMHQSGAYGITWSIHSTGNAFDGRILSTTVNNSTPEFLLLMAWHDSWECVSWVLWSQNPELVPARWNKPVERMSVSFSQSKGRERRVRQLTHQMRYVLFSNNLRHNAMLFAHRECIMKQLHNIVSMYIDLVLRCKRNWNVSISKKFTLQRTRCVKSRTEKQRREKSDGPIFGVAP